MTQKAYHIQNPGLSDRCILVESLAVGEILIDHFLIGSTPYIEIKKSGQRWFVGFFTLQSKITPNPQMFSY